MMFFRPADRVETKAGQIQISPKPDELLCRAYDPGGTLGYFLGGYVPPGTPNWHPVLEKISPKIDSPL